MIVDKSNDSTRLPVATCRKLIVSNRTLGGNTEDSVVFSTINMLPPLAVKIVGYSLFRPDCRARTEPLRDATGQRMLSERRMRRVTCCINSAPCCSSDAMPCCRNLASCVAISTPTMVMLIMPKMPKKSRVSIRLKAERREEFKADEEIDELEERSSIDSISFSRFFDAIAKRLGFIGIT